MFAALALAAVIHVRPGDTLSGIARERCHSAADWTGIWKASRAAGYVGADPDLILPGQKIVLNCAKDGLPVIDAAVRPAVQAVPVVTSHAAAAPAAHAAPVARIAAAPSGSFQACVIARESGGSAQVWNASGHWGLYQFSASTWARYGGSPASFGHASSAEQTRVFDSAIAAGGASNWSAYDGC